MTLEQIKKAVEEGKTVCWANDNYEVIKDRIGQWLIWSKCNDHCIGLTHMDGITMNGREDQFYTKGGETEYLFVACMGMKEVQKWIRANSEHEGRKLFADSLTDEQKNATEYVDMIDLKRC